MTAPLLLILAADALVVVLMIRNFRCRTAEPPISIQILESSHPMVEASTNCPLPNSNHFRSTVYHFRQGERGRRCRFLGQASDR